MHQEKQVQLKWDIFQIQSYFIYTTQLYLLHIQVDTKLNGGSWKRINCSIWSKMFSSIYQCWPETLSLGLCVFEFDLLLCCVCAQCLGDQSAALVGQMCFKDGQAKNTWVAQTQRLLTSSSSLEDEALSSPTSFSLAFQLRDGLFPPAQHRQQGTGPS